MCQAPCWASDRHVTLIFNNLEEGLWLPSCMGKKIEAQRGSVTQQQVAEQDLSPEDVRGAFRM